MQAERGFHAEVATKVSAEWPGNHTARRNKLPGFWVVWESAIFVAVRIVTVEEDMAEEKDLDRFLRLNEVLHVTGLARNTVYRRIREGTFPTQVRIGPNSVAWRQSAIAKWMSDIVSDASVAAQEET